MKNFTTPGTRLARLLLRLRRDVGYWRRDFLDIALFRAKHGDIVLIDGAFAIHQKETRGRYYARKMLYLARRDMS